MVPLTGDNLGINAVLGFCGGFSGTFYCRRCRQSITECRESVLECHEKLRTQENYESDVSNAERGVNERCIFIQ